MREQLKRKAVIQQLNKLGIHSVEGQPLEDAMYTTLLKTLAHKRAKKLGGNFNEEYWNCS